MSEQTILLCCAFGIPFVVIALGIAAVGFVLRRLRPDLYMTDEEKAVAEEKLRAELESAGKTDNTNKTDLHKE